MQELDDHELLAAYAREHSGDAFATLVGRYVNLVYSAGLRCTGNAAAAEEISQAVFIILAQKASTLGPKIILSGWLYHTARLTAANYMRTERRRQLREHTAYMQSLTNENPDLETAWQHVGPLLEEALGTLGASDRDAVVLRYFQNKSAREIADALRVEPATAHKRVERAVGKLRKFFLKRGVTLSVAAIAGAVAANSVQAAPVGLAKTISTMAMVKGATASTSTLALVKGALKIMAWSNAKLAVVAGVAILLTAGGTVAVVEAVASPHVNAAYWELKPENLDKAPPVLILRSAQLLDGGAVLRNEGLNKITCAIAHHEDLKEMIWIAYSANWPRIVLPPDTTDARYDLMMTLRDHPREALQAAIRRQLGFTAHTQIVTTNVLLLRVSDATLLAKHAAPATMREQYSQTEHSWVFANFPINESAEYMEICLNTPIEVAPGLDGGYSGTITVPDSEPRRVVTRRSLKTVISELNKMGLDLVATNMPIEMLVVERAK